MMRWKQGIALAVIAAFTMCAAGCNTMKGVGRDVKRSGEGIEKTADKTQEKMHEKKIEKKQEKKHY